jgi:hypothetical protein
MAARASGVVPDLIGVETKCDGSPVEQASVMKQLLMKELEMSKSSPDRKTEQRFA